MKISGQPGYQGSDHTGCDATFYCQGQDPVYPDGVLGPIRLNYQAQDDQSMASSDLRMAFSTSTVSEMNWTKSIGPASGQWSLGVKTHHPEVFEQNLRDGDWVDLVLTQHDRQYMQCRGVVDTVRCMGSIGGSGATDKLVTIRGRDHGRIWEDAIVSFERFLNLHLDRAEAKQAFDASLYGDVAATTHVFLFSFLERLASRQATARFRMPPGMPGLTTLFGEPKYFRDCVNFQNNQYSDSPPRIAIGPWQHSPGSLDGHSLWDLAMEWGDPYFCELFCDLFLDGQQPGLDTQLRPVDAQMGLVLRDRPFPSTAYRTKAGNLPISIGLSRWWDLPQHIVNTQEIVVDDVGYGGEERYNTIYVRMPANAETAESAFHLQLPLIDEIDIERRGVRELSVSSPYAAAKGNWATMLPEQRGLLRDFHGLNPYMLNGSLALGRLRPEIRIGQKIRIPGPTPEGDLTFYVQGLNHSWRLGAGRTNLTVTRGWRGTDQSLMAAIQALSTRFTVPRDLTSYPQPPDPPLEIV